MTYTLLLPGLRKKCEDCRKNKICSWEVIYTDGSKHYVCSDCYPPF